MEALARKLIFDVTEDDLTKLVLAKGRSARRRANLLAAELKVFFGWAASLRGNLWGFLILIAVFPVLAWRLIDEEPVLLRDLKAYAEYRRKVPWRLVPHIW